MSKLNEGLSSGDLKYLILPMLSVDEYESKIDDNSIVIGFYAKDQEPANDLNRFIQKSAIEILDSDVSPAPTEDGFYMVFVELLRDATTPEKIMDLLGTLEGLTENKAYKANFFGKKGLVPVDVKSIKKFTRLLPQEEE